MPKIILIETSTSLCTTALLVNGKVVSRKESAEQRAQASLTAPFIKQMLDENGLKVSDCDAVCVSSGPGSYTGLRVGVSTAKGLCFAAGLPLIGVNTLDILVAEAVDEGLLPEGCTHIVPMIDARRMEVYTAVYALRDGEFVRESDINPMVIDSGSFSGIRRDGTVLFIGDGAAKCAEVLDGERVSFMQTNPHAYAMARAASRAWEEKRFENTAYFEPFYLKQFVATVSRKKLF